MANYPFDEFDQVPEGFSGTRANHRRQGVHREEPRTTKRLGLWLIVATAIMALIIGAAAFFLLPRLGLSSEGNDVAAPKQNNRSQASSPASTSSPSSSNASSAQGTTPSAVPSSAAAVDSELPIAVYNATATPGLAGRIADNLEREGFAKGDTANWSGAAVSASVVFYQEESQRSTAEAVARTLNVAEVTQGNPREIKGVAVVLGPDLLD